MIVGKDGKSQFERIFLVLSLAMPVAIITAGILIIRTPSIPNIDSSLQKNIVGGLFIVYAVYRLFKIVRRIA